MVLSVDISFAQRSCNSGNRVRAGDGAYLHAAWVLGGS